MLTEKFRSLLEEYHRKKWFPEKYSDPYGEFIDYVSEGMISDLLATWQREKRSSYLHAARYILQLLPEIQFQEIFNKYNKALSEPLSGNISPESTFFWIRNSPEEKASELWTEIQQWTRKWENPLSECGRKQLEFESKHSDFYKSYTEHLQLPEVSVETLRVSGDLFAWQFQNRTKAANYWQLQRHFQLENWKTAAQWSQLSALANTVATTIGIKRVPVLREAAEPASQYLFPVQPPARVILEYGLAQGPYETLRFLTELGKGIFYAGMNPENPIDERVCGDPSLPCFWGYLFGSLLADPEAVKVLIGSRAENLPEDISFVLQCWYRYELFLALYRIQVANDLGNLEDHYRGLWELSFPTEPPHFLFLYDLCRSAESIYRSTALLWSQQVIRQLQSKYGRRWFANRTWIGRAREYWWEGFRITTKDILKDLQLPDSSEYPF